MTALLGGAAGLLLGAWAGVGIRLLLAGLRRGAVIRPGPIEVACALLTAAATAATWDSPRLATAIWITVFGVAAGAVDIRHHRLPDALTMPGLLVTLAVLAATEWANPAAGGLVRSAGAAAVVAALFAVPAVLLPSAMGWGDVKLAVSLGAVTGYLSWEAVALGVCAGFVLAAVVALAGVAAGRWTTRSPVPLGPFLVAGAWAVLLLTPA